MRPRTQKQPQVKKEPCRVLDDGDVDVFEEFHFHNGFHFFGADTHSFRIDEGTQKFYGRFRELAFLIQIKVSFLECLKSGLQVFAVVFH